MNEDVTMVATRAEPRARTVADAMCTTAPVLQPEDSVVRARELRIGTSSWVTCPR
jgi:hypothetical protein